VSVLQHASTAAAAALTLAGSDPTGAVEAARSAERMARRERNPAALSTAQRARGLARRELGDLPAALAALRTAVRTAELADLPEPAAEARMSLAFALLQRGRLAAALAEADLAARALTGTAEARLQAQRAVVLQRCGRFDEALEEFRTSLPVLQRADDRLWEARLRNNRGLLHADRGDLDAAEVDLTRSGELYTELGHHLLAANTASGLGDVAAKRGDICGALACYDRAAVRYAGSDVPVPELLVDRAKVLLAAGLVEEARQCADHAADELRALLRDTDVAETELLQAECALALGHPRQAREIAAQAEGRLRRQHRPGWALVARYVRLRASAATGDPVDVGAAARTADALHAAGWRAHGLDARIIAAQAALALGRVGLAEQHLRRATAARSGTVELRVRAWYAEALLRQSAGRPVAMEAALRAGMRAVDAHRASLGATELRVRASSHGDALAGLGLRSALSRRDALGVLTWSERYRAGTARLRPVSPPQNGELAGLLAELRQVSSDLEDALLASVPGAGSSTRALRNRQTALERAVISCSRRVTGEGRHGGAAVSVAALRDSLSAKALVTYLVLDDRLHAVTLTDRRLRLHALGDRAHAARALAAAHFALRRLATGRGSPMSVRAAATAVAHAAGTLDALLVAPLAAELDDRPLVVVPTAALHAVPWALLPSLAGRPMVVSPSATVWQRAAVLPPVSVAGLGLLVAGPRLTEAAAEVTALAALHPGATCLTGVSAGVQNVLTALGQVDWAHVAAHGTLRTDNPLFSALELTDGALTVYDLEHLPRVPGLIVLPVCQSGVGAIHAGEEVLGLAGALLSRGARTLVATVVPVPDAASRELMLELHARLTTSDDVPAALASASASLSREDPAALAAVAGFVCLGA
jgi:CHAT domain-containing protein